MNLLRTIWHSRWLSEKRKIEWYPAFWLMRIKVLHLSPCWREVRILLPHTWIATNTGGSLFGGFQACLADPIAAMVCMKVFPGYSVWTRSLHLDFQHEGSTDLELRFNRGIGLRRPQHAAIRIRFLSSQRQHVHARQSQYRDSSARL
jgi:acyl-coenzyme A thioesterase PaaI-like protein